MHYHPSKVRILETNALLLDRIFITVLNFPSELDTVSFRPVMDLAIEKWGCGLPQSLDQLRGGECGGIQNVVE